MSDLKDHVLSIIKTIEEGAVYDCEYQAEENGAEVGDIMGGYDYLTDVLDIQFIVSGNSEYLGARILVTFGGPNIWIDTQRQCVDGAWWGDRFSESYYNDEMDIDGALRELWQCR